MKICFYARDLQAILYPKLAKKFLKDGHECIFITQNKNETETVKQLYEGAIIYEIEEYLRTNWESLLDYDIAKYEDKYSIASLWDLLYSDRFLREFKYDDCIRFINGHIKFYEHVFEKEKPNYFINEAIAIFSSYIEYFIGKYYKVEYVGFMGGRLETNSKVYLIKDQFQMNFQLDEMVEKDEFSNEEIAKAAEYINNFKNNHVKPEAEKVQRVKPKFTFRFFLDIAKYLVSLFMKKYNNKYDYIYYKQNKRFLDPIVFYTRYKILKGLFIEPDFNKKFLYFPIHFEPEAATLVCASKYQNQLNAIYQIAQNIPGDYQLYVKEHYVSLIHKKMGFYRELKKYPNIKLIDSFVDSHDLIKNSDGVITLTGTGGWEAILYGKPVYVLGNIFYDTFVGANKVYDVQELSIRIKEQQNKKVENNALLKYISAYIKSLHAGNYNFGDPQSMSDENVENLYNALKTEIKKENQEIYTIISEC